MNSYKDYFLLSDLDGTLINSKGFIDRENILAIEDFIKKGGTFSVATGRTKVSAKQFLQNIKINAPCIFFNGGVVYDLEKNEMLHNVQLEKDSIVNIIKKILISFPENIIVEIMSDDNIFIVSKNDMKDKFILRDNIPFTNTDLEKLLTKSWEKIMFYSENGTLKLAEEFLISENINEVAELVFSQHNYLEILPKNISKGYAINWLKNTPEYKNKKFVAIGDYDNDILMLANADFGVAVENASPKCKAVADLITVNNDNFPIKVVINDLEKYNF